jgi:azurin
VTRSRLAACFVATLLFYGSPNAHATPRRATVTRTIHVKLSTTGNEVMFDQQRIDLPFVKNIRLRYKNDAPLDSQISHNVAIIRPERVDSVMSILQEHDYDLGSVRGSADILALTRVLNPGQQDVVNFSPPAPGEYVYICLMPGHGDMLGMRGLLVINSLPTKN